MKKTILPVILSVIVGIGITVLYFNLTTEKPIVATQKSKILYSTEKTEGYYFPTHNNLLVMDRSNAESSEVFVVEVGPNKHTHRHVHDDTEQLFYVLSGTGYVNLERDGKTETYQIKPTELVHIPRNCFHQTFANQTDTLRYLAIDCFPKGHNRAEPTWDSHARVVCKNNNWDYDEARIKKAK